MPWSEKTTPPAAAGLHKTRINACMIIFDEASEIPLVIFRVTKGALIDDNTEIIFLAIGNPTMNSGPFFEAVFGNQPAAGKFT